MTHPRYAIGLDLSLTHTGLAAIDIDTGQAFTHDVRSKGKKTDTTCQQVQRIDQLTEQIMTSVHACRPEVVVVESALFSTTADTSAHRRAGLWWSVVGACVRAGYRVIEVAPSQVKKYATGKGNADKELMVRRAHITWGEDVCPGNDDNRADALAMADLGVAGVGGTSALNPTAYRAELVAQLFSTHPDADTLG